MKKAVLHWSGGKDCAYMLYLLRKQNKILVDRLFVMVSSKENRVSAHGINKALIEKQAEYIGLPVTFLELPEFPSNKDYEHTFLQAMKLCKKEGIDFAAFGDIFLKDVRQYREAIFRGTGLTALFPLWELDTGKIAKQFISSGFRANVICVNGSKLDKSFAGREYDQSFLNDLPKNVDPCGENGEFHTFVYDGPVFSKSVAVKAVSTYVKVVSSPDQPHKDIRFYYSDLANLE
jgi:uncharacterized protein (TIGR00290 family)